MEIQFCGAAGGVTGSKHYVACDDFQFLVDCGMAQERGNADLNWKPFLEDPSALDAVFLTHAHLDHCGLLPKLVKDGFRGKIYGTPATLELTKLILLDSAHIQEEDAAFKQKRHAKEGRKSPRPVRPLYTQSDVEATARLFVPIPYWKRKSVAKGVEVVFRDAGHILGSAFIEVVLTKPQIEGDEPRRLLFSGDLGRADRPIIRDPEFYKEPDEIADLFIESTYGDRISAPIDTVDDQLAEIIGRTAARGGKAIMPVFAVERAQEMICRFANLIERGRIPANIPIYLDSPMAVEATMIFSRQRDCFDDETIALGERAREILKNLHLVKTQQESKAINKQKGSAIIMSSAGMCNAGRIKHHLANNIGNPLNSVVFLGYQAEGTLGRQILDGVNPVRIHGQPRAVKAEIVVVKGISGHADQSELLAWYDAIPKRPKTTFVVHGEPAASQALADRIKALAPETNVYVPKLMDLYKE
ncbi:MAG: MBL fold metallo-hydrolase [Thermoguttaceae bacterium]|nr:MBL fold metallo-hydrolase [Thermoguttaceae bacterium]